MRALVALLVPTLIAMSIYQAMTRDWLALYSLALALDLWRHRPKMEKR